MLLQIPHAARRLAAGRSFAPVSCPYLLTSSSPPKSSLIHTPRFTSLRPHSLTSSSIGQRYCSSHTRYRMSGETPQTPKELRKYLQQSHDRIFENNKQWAEEMKKKKPEFFTDLSAGQAPDYLWIGESIAPSRPHCHYRLNLNKERFG